MARIMVIDDDPSIREVLEQVLKSVGHQVVSAPNGTGAIQQCAGLPADLVITDIYMPNVDGIEVIRELRQLYPEVAVIAMSGRENAGTMLSVAQKLGAVSVLHKPFESGEVLQAVRDALGGRGRGGN